MTSKELKGDQLHGRVENCHNSPLLVPFLEAKITSIHTRTAYAGKWT